MKLVALTDVCDFQGGTQPPKSDWIKEPSDQHIRMLQIRDFTQPDKDNIEYVKKTKKLKLCNEDDILIGRYGASIGKILTGLSGAYNVAIIKTIPNKELLSKKFLFHLLKGPRFQAFINAIGARAAQAGFNKTDLSKFIFPLLSFDGQIRIAALLSRIEALIATRKDNLHLLDEFLKSTFLEMFGIQSGEYKQWKSEKLILHTDIVSGVTKGKKYKTDALTEIPYMRVANVQDGFLNLKEIKSISVTQAEIDKYKLIRGDVLLTEGGDPDKLGRGAVWEEQIEKCIHQNHIFRVRVLNWDTINPYYLSALIGSIYGKSYFLKAAKQTTGIASINSTQLKNFPLIIAPIDLQNNYALIADKVEILKTLYQHSLKELNNLYGALSQKAFKGELDLSRIPLGKEHEEAISDAAQGIVDQVPEPDSYAMSDSAARERLLRQLFDTFIADRKGFSFSLDDFWTEAERKVADHMDDESPPLGVSDYDKTRAWLFELLESGRINQRFDEENNRMELSIKT